MEDLILFVKSAQKTWYGIFILNDFTVTSKILNVFYFLNHNLMLYSNIFSQIKKNFKLCFY